MDNNSTPSIKDMIDISSDFKKGEKQQYVYETIKEAILKNVLAPQERIVENDLMELFKGFSRTPIRDALMRLTFEGYIENVPDRGMFVSNVSFKDLIEILEIRTKLESLSVKYFIERSYEKIEKLEEIFSNQQEYFEDGNLDKELEYDNSFHIMIAEGSLNNKLSNLIENFVLDCQRGGVYLIERDENRAEKSLFEHQIIFNAIKEKDIQKASESMVAHLQGWVEYVKHFHMYKFFLMNF